MLYEPTNTPAMARTSNLNEELGQVNMLNTTYVTLRHQKRAQEVSVTPSPSTSSPR